MTQVKRLPPIPPETRKIVMARYKGLCIYCRAPANGLDHIYPKSLAGSTNDPINLVPACMYCNAFVNNRPFRSLEEKIKFVRNNRLRGVFCRGSRCANEHQSSSFFHPKVWWQIFCSIQCSTQYHVERYWRRRLEGKSKTPPPPPVREAGACCTENSQEGRRKRLTRRPTC